MEMFIATVIEVTVKRIATVNGWFCVIAAIAEIDGVIFNIFIFFFFLSIYKIGVAFLNLKELW